MSVCVSVCVGVFVWMCLCVCVFGNGFLGGLHPRCQTFRQ